MGKTNKHEFTQILTGTNPLTGSIVAVANLNQGVIDNIAFGTYINGGTSDQHQHYATNIALSDSDGGEYAGSGLIEGPIVSVKLASGTAIIYYNGQLV